MGGADDPLVKVTVFIRASVLLRLRDHAGLVKSSVSQLCRDGALAELDRAIAAAGEATP